MVTTPQKPVSAVQATGPSPGVNLDNLSPAMLLKLIQDLQLENQALRVETTKAVTDRERLVNHVKATKKGKSNNRDEPSEPTPLDVQLKRFAHIYGLMYAPWVSIASLGVPRPLINPYSLERFANEQSRADGIVAELYDMLPANCHEPFLQSSAVQAMFKKIVGLQRATMVHDAKLQARLIFLPFGELIAQAIHNHNYDAPHIQWLLKGDSGSYRTKYPPIIFPPDNVGETSYAYRGPILVNTARLFTGGSGILQPDHPPPSSTTSRRKYDIRTTKPGFIAFVVQAARFLASPDPKFTPVGAVTGITYLEDFHSTKELLIKSSLRPGKRGERYRDLIAFWDREVFGYLWGNAAGNQAAALDPAVDEVDAGFEEDWDADSDDEGKNQHPAVQPGRSTAASSSEYIEIDDEEGEESEEGEEDEEEGEGAGEGTGAGVGEGRGEGSEEEEDEADEHADSETEDERSLTLSQLEPLTGSWPTEGSSPSHRVTSTAVPKTGGNHAARTVRPRPVPPIGALAGAPVVPIAVSANAPKVAPSPAETAGVIEKSSPAFAGGDSQGSVGLGLTSSMSREDSARLAAQFLHKSYNGNPSAPATNLNEVLRHSLSGPLSGQGREAFDRMVTEFVSYMNNGTTLQLPAHIAAPSDLSATAGASEPVPAVGSPFTPASNGTTGTSSNTDDDTRVAASKKTANGKVITMYPALLPTPSDYPERLPFIQSPAAARKMQKRQSEVRKTDEPQTGARVTRGRSRKAGANKKKA